LRMRSRDYQTRERKKMRIKRLSDIREREKLRMRAYQTRERKKVRIKRLSDIRGRERK